MKHIQGSSGHLYKTEEGEWEWSDEEFTEPSIEEAFKQVVSEHTYNHVELKVL